MSIAEEEYIHLLNSIDDLDEARHVLIAVRDAQPGILRNAAFRYALIAYCRPYSPSQGLERKLRLQVRHVPTQYRSLHEKILASRDKIHAHTDRDIREAKLHISQIGGQKFVIPISNIIDAIEGINNIDVIIDLIERSLDLLIAEEEAMRATL